MTYVVVQVNKKQLLYRFDTTKLSSSNVRETMAILEEKLINLWISSTNSIELIRPCSKYSEKRHL